jgi:hypothetical protein
LRSIRHLLLREWETSLGEALTDRPLGRRAIASALLFWRQGTRAEQSYQMLDVAAYARLCQDKLRWIGVAGRCMLRSLRAEEAGAFELAYALFLQALQCIDDAGDAQADRRSRGQSVAQSLGTWDGALLRAAPYLAHRAVEIAAQAGFGKLAEQFRGLLEVVEGWVPVVAPIQSELQGQILAMELEQSVIAWHVAKHGDM